jgi:hypothetical protein
MYKITTIAVAVFAVGFYIFVLNGKIKSLEQKNKSLKTELKVCKSTKDAKDFEIKWSNEFLKNLNYEVKDEKISTQNDTNNTFSDTF